MPRQTRAHRHTGEPRRADAAVGEDGYLGLAHDVGGGEGLDQRDRLDIADAVVGGAIAPGPGAGEFEDAEAFAGEEFRNGIAGRYRGRPEESLARPAGPLQCASIMRGYDPASEVDIGDVAPESMDARIERERCAGKGEVKRLPPAPAAINAGG